MRKNISSLLLIISLSIVSLSNSKGIYLPFKTVPINEPSSFKPSDVLNIWGQSLLYTIIKIGTPLQNIKAFLSTSSYETFLFEHMCSLSDSSYNTDSSSYSFITDINYLFHKQIKSKIINETVQLYTDMTQTKTFEFKDMSMIYSENKKEDFKENGGTESYINIDNTCLNIGFEPKYSIAFGYDLGLVTQLKRRDIITSYDFTVKYNEDNKNNNEGYLVIGAKAHEFDSQHFFQEQYILTGALNKDFLPDWTLDFDKVYYTGKKSSNKDKIEKKLLNAPSIRINLDIGGIIYGSSAYEKEIKEDFFDYLIQNGQCFVDENNNIRTYYCKKESYNNVIKDCFPTLFFELKQLNATFELNYKDLFREKNEFMFFLIIFGKLNTYDSFFEVGKIFLKKYLLTFNYDSKMIGFYNKNIPLERKGENEVYNSNGGGKVAWKIILIIVLVGVLIGIGFLLGKKVYDTVRKKRANELNDEYDYKSGNNNNGEDQQNSPITDDNGP